MQRIFNYDRVEIMDQDIVLQDYYYWRELRNQKEYWSLRLYFKLLEVYILTNSKLLQEELDSEYIHHIVLEKFYYNSRDFVQHIDEICWEEDRAVGIELSMYWYQLLKRATNNNFGWKCSHIAESSEDIILWIESVTQLLAANINELFENCYSLCSEITKGVIKNPNILECMQPKRTYNKLSPKFKNSPYKLIILFNTVVKSNQFYDEYFEELDRITGKYLDILYKPLQKIIPMHGYREINKVKWINDLAKDKELPCIIAVNLLDGYVDLLDLSDLDNDTKSLFKVIKLINKQLKETIDISNNRFKEIIENTKKGIKAMNNKENGNQTGDITGSVVIFGDNEGDIEIINHTVNDNIDMKKILQDIEVVFEKMQLEEKWSKQFGVLAQLQEILEESNTSKQIKLLNTLKRKSGDFLIGVCSSLTATALLSFLTVAPC